MSQHNIELVTVEPARVTTTNGGSEDGGGGLWVYGVGKQTCAVYIAEMRRTCASGRGMMQLTPAAAAAAVMHKTCFYNKSERRMQAFTVIIMMIYTLNSPVRI